MKTIVVGTNRAGSNSKKIALIVKRIYESLGESVEILDLHTLPLNELSGSLYGKDLPPAIAQAVETINRSEGLIMVVPEYNGSMPGALKYFIDFWSYPKSFEHRPVCFIGLGGMFGGLRPVEHLQQVFGYRNAFLFPDRVFMIQVHKNISPEGEIMDAKTQELLVRQATGFSKFVKGLAAVGLLPKN